MPIEMVPAPSRILKQVSTWIVLLTGIGDLVHGLLIVFADQHLLTTGQVTIANAVLLFIAAASKLVQQNIALTVDQKAAVIASVKAAPVKVPKGAGEPQPLP